MSLDKIKAKLEALKQQSQGSGEKKEFSNLLWKPSPGKQVIRILPNIPLGFMEKPFVPIDFYYNFGKAYQMSPSNFDRPDPVIEYCNGLIPPGPKLPRDEWEIVNELKKKLLPQTSIFVPILVRGEEHLGVKFWRFSRKVYQSIAAIFDEDDYADAASLTSGLDFTIEFIPSPDPKDQRQAKTIPTPKRNSSPASEDPAVIKMINEMPNIYDQFTEPSYDELKNALRAYLQVPENTPSVKKEEPKPSTNPTDVRVNHAATNEGFDVKVQAPTTSIPDFDKEFDDILNSMPGGK